MTSNSAQGGVATVNWREDVEFIYVLCILVSGVILFFHFYNNMGLSTAGTIMVGIVLVELVAAYLAFETDRAISNWEKIERGTPEKVKP